MPVRKFGEIEETEVSSGDVLGVTKKIPIGKKEGWEGYSLRVFKIAPGGHTSKHQHDWEHVNYIISGKGRLMIDGVMHEVEEKDFALVPPNKIHQFQNPYDRDFEFICIVPNRGEY
ncbi:MAG: cupin domain-containing protein [bacterium]|jgi:quercetin dioxygenase-like cupin family protein